MCILTCENASRTIENKTPQHFKRFEFRKTQNAESDLNRNLAFLKSTQFASFWPIRRWAYDTGFDKGCCKSQGSISALLHYWIHPQIGKRTARRSDVEVILKRRWVAIFDVKPISTLSLTPLIKKLWRLGAKFLHLPKFKIIKIWRNTFYSLSLCSSR